MTKITRNEFLVLLGLATLQRQNAQRSENYYNAVKKLHGENVADYFNDACYDDAELETILLEKLSLAKVEVMKK